MIQKKPQKLWKNIGHRRIRYGRWDGRIPDSGLFEIRCPDSSAGQETKVPYSLAVVQCVCGNLHRHCFLYEKPGKYGLLHQTWQFSCAFRKYWAKKMPSNHFQFWCRLKRPAWSIRLAMIWLIFFLTGYFSFCFLFFLSEFLFLAVLERVFRNNHWKEPMDSI